MDKKLWAGLPHISSCTLPYVYIKIVLNFKVDRWKLV